MKRLEFWIPGKVTAQNVVWRMKLRLRIAEIKAQRERAMVHAMVAMREQGVEAFTGPARIHMTVFLTRRLDPRDNAHSLLKHYVDGFCNCPHTPKHPRPTCPTLLLPNGDGINSGYIWDPPDHRLARPRDQGVKVVVEEIANPNQGGGS